jgi:hypothetical protein
VQIVNRNLPQSVGAATTPATPRGHWRGMGSLESQERCARAPEKSNEVGKSQPPSEAAVGSERSTWPPAQRHS